MILPGSPRFGSRTMTDEDVCESWEEAADSGEIERRLEAKLKTIRKAKSNEPVRTGVVIPDESLPAAPPPRIRILRRPPSEGAPGARGAGSRLAQTLKPLKQREAEYAEARRRIWGGAEDGGGAGRHSAAPSDVPQPGGTVTRQPLGPDGTPGFHLCR